MNFVYRLLKQLVRFALGIYYPKTVVKNREYLQVDKPTILVTNHPNTLVDVLEAAMHHKKQVHFLANAGLFGTPFTNWLFTKLYCIPIQRKEDKKLSYIKNSDSFDRCDTFLGNGGCLFIAPEGGSVKGKRIRNLKTGTARIALRAEQKKAYQLGLVIQPIGINYEAPQKYGSNIFLNVGHPIEVSKYAQQYREAPREAITTMTNDIEQAMKALIVNTEDEEIEQLSDQYFRLLPMEQTNGLATQFGKMQTFVQQAQVLRKNDRDRFLVLKNGIQEIIDHLDKVKVQHLLVPLKEQNSFQWRYWINWLSYYFGLIHHYVPAKLATWIENKLGLIIEYKVTVIVGFGLLVFPLYYLFLGLLIGRFWSTGIVVLYLLLVFWSGKSWPLAKRFLERKKSVRFAKKAPVKLKELYSKKEDLMKLLGVDKKK